MRRLIFPLISVVTLLCLFNTSLPVLPNTVFRRAQVIPNNVIRSQYSISLKMKESPEAEFVDKVGGTAVAIGPRKLVSAAHVFLAVEKMSGFPYQMIPFQIDLRDRKGEVIERIRVQVTKIIDGLDLALLEVPQDLPNYISLGTEKAFERLEIGANLYIIGAQYGLSPYNISHGNLSSKYIENRPGIWQISTTAFGGNSGGGVFEEDTNEFVGIVVSIASANNESGGGNVTFIIPLDVIKKFCK